MIEQITKTPQGYEIILDGQTLSVPEAGGNRHYQMVLEAIENGQPVLDPPGPTDEELAVQVRAERDKLLTESDWTQVADAPVDQAAWATYRQALRDVPEQEGFPENVVWPTTPE